MVLKVLIVEDDANMRLILKRALLGIQNVEVVGEAESGIEAVRLTSDLEPHVIIMDVDLPGKDGIEASKEILDIIPDVILIYATGHPEYMAEAFEVYAFDYLVKPYKIERLIQTISKIRNLMEKKQESISAIERIPRDTTGIKNKIAVRIDRNLTLIDTTKVIYISREKRKTAIYIIGGKIMTNESLEVLEKRLKFSNFMRTHRSYLVNLDKVTEIQPWSRNDYLVIFSGIKEAAYITDEKYRLLKQYLNL
jgi:two-component system LytT family response regulator